MDGIKEMVGRKVYAELSSGRKYTGVVLSCDDNFICIKDKFGSDVCFAISEIKLLQEER